MKKVLSSIIMVLILSIPLFAYASLDTCWVGNFCVLVGQEQSNWCWAACSNAILYFYDSDTTQCEIANYARQQQSWCTKDCCDYPSSSCCNRANCLYGANGNIDDILNNFGSIGSIGHDSALTVGQIIHEFCWWHHHCRPFIIRWGWSNGGGHFLVAQAIFVNDDTLIAYMDPEPVNQGSYHIADYDYVVSATSHHEWTHTLTLTKDLCGFEEWVKPENMGPIVNSSSDELGPVIYRGQLYFSSDKPGGCGGYDIYVSTMEGGVWGAPDSVWPLNSEYNERAPSIACVDGHPVVFFASDRDVGYDVWASRNDSLCPHTPISAWNPPDLVSEVSTPYYDEGMPTISPDGNTLYFGSDRPDGYGGSDIWVSYRIGKGWTEPENLGSVINSPYNEAGPSISDDGRILYFSSNRPGGYGGIDLYMSRKVAGEWTAPVNLGPPVNTEVDETCAQPSGNSLYFRSNRPGGYGEGDLYVTTKLAPIPTLTEWGLIIFGVVLIGFITYVFLRRRRKAVVSYQ